MLTLACAQLTLFSRWLILYTVADSSAYVLEARSLLDLHRGKLVCQRSGLLSLATSL